MKVAPLIVTLIALALLILGSIGGIIFYALYKPKANQDDAEKKPKDKEEEK